MGATDPAQEPWTVGRVLRWAAEDFAKRGNTTARLDAELLLSRVLGIDRLRLILEANRPLTEPELGAYRELIKRRRAAEPVAYILGEREFYALPIRVDRRVLIPRPDTETLVDVALERTRDRSMYGSALDLCTGSGCVAIAIAKQRPTWKVTATDVDENTAALAWENVLRTGVAHHLRVLLGDLFAAVPEGERFDLVTANPPYIPSAEIATLDADVRDYEPRRALDGGPDGLDLVRRIVATAPDYLTPGGVLALEIGHDQAERTEALLRERGFRELQRRRDYGGHERVVSGRWDG
jgi:release factor glutamine methyltransferase